MDKTGRGRILVGLAIATVFSVGYSADAAHNFEFLTASVPKMLVEGDVSSSHQGARKLEDEPEWKKHLAEAMAFAKKGDRTNAKRCFLESLSILEKNPRKSKRTSASLLRLELGILSLYPQFPREHATGTTQEKIKQDQEEIDVLARLQLLNQLYSQTNNPFVGIVQTQQNLVLEDLRNNQSALTATKHKSKTP